MPHHTYRFGALTVAVSEGVATVRRRKVRYRARVQGRDAVAAASVLDDLLLALSDPEAFVSDRMGEATGAQAIRRWREARRVVYAARKFGFAALEEAVEDARGRGVL